MKALPQSAEIVGPHLQAAQISEMLTPVNAAL